MVEHSILRVNEVSTSVTDISRNFEMIGRNIDIIGCELKAIDKQFQGMMIYSLVKTICIVILIECMAPMFV